MKKRVFEALVAGLMLSAAVPTLSLAEGSAPAQGVAIDQDAPVYTAAAAALMEKSIGSISFTSEALGTPKESLLYLFDAIQECSTVPVTISIDGLLMHALEEADEHSGWYMPAIEGKGVSILTFLHLLAGTQSEIDFWIQVDLPEGPEFVSVALGFDPRLLNTTERLVIRAVLYEDAVASSHEVNYLSFPDRVPDDVFAYQTDLLVEESADGEVLRIEDLVATIQIAWELSDVEKLYPLQVRYHENTGMLFVRGRADRLLLVDKVLSQLAGGATVVERSRAARTEP